MKGTNINKIQEIQKSLLTQDDCMELLGVSRSTLYNYRDSGLLVPVKLGGKVRYRLSDVELFLNGKRG